jgi:hypothetical protein
MEKENEMNEKPALSKTAVSGSYSLDDVRNIVLEMRNEALCGLIGEQRWDMQKRLGKIRDKWNLGY